MKINKESIVYKKINELHLNERNPRKNDEAVATVAKSIEKYGFRNPLIVDSNGKIYCGNTRYKAALQLGLKECPCIVADDLTEQQIREYALIDNKSNEIAEWDFDLLSEELEDLDLDDFGFDWGLPEDEEEKEIIEDTAPEVDEQTEPICKTGDIWQLGNHKLVCGDSTDRATIERLMDGVKADMVFTDPPYGYNFQSNMRTATEQFAVLENDDKILDFFPNIKEFCNGFVYVCGMWKTIDKWIELFKQYLDLTNVIIWDKGGGGIGDLYHTFATDYEMILVCNNGKELKGRRYGPVWNFTNTEIAKMKKEELVKVLLEQKEYQSIWQIKKDAPSAYVHPTQKPVALSAKAIRSSIDFGESCLDLFGGSGSTMIACEQLGRKCYMCEIDPKYCDVILKRYIAFKGTDKEVFMIEADGTKTAFAEIERR